MVIMSTSYLLMALMGVGLGTHLLLVERRARRAIAVRASARR